MCGIAGIYNLNRESIAPSILLNMTESLRHRGPDAEGYLFYNTLGNNFLQYNFSSHIGEVSSCNLALGQRRLKIIDLSDLANQPMSNEDESIWIVLNGEIYNFKELRRILVNKGHRFKSNVDIEVIIHLYEEKGVDCLAELNGMFAFVLWDARKNLLFCARDRMGEMPFYYYYDKKRFIFASELKAFLTNPYLALKPNDRVIYKYLAEPGGFSDLSENTFFESLYALKPAHYLLVGEDKELIYKSYWELPLNSSYLNIKEENGVEQFYDLFKDSVNSRLSADVPISFYLSGGLDSSSVIAMAKKLGKHTNLNAYTVIYPSPYNKWSEIEYAEEVAKFCGVFLNKIEVKANEVFKELPKIIWHIDEPAKSLRIYSQWTIIKSMAGQKNKVMINGEGGDELLLGYPKMNYFLFADLLSSFYWSKLIREMRGFNKIYGYTFLNSLFTTLRMMRSINPDIKKRIHNKVLKLESGIDKNFALGLETGERILWHKNSAELGYVKMEIQHMLSTEPIPHTLHINDRLNMAFSMESRAPFMDHKLIEFCLRLHPFLKIREGISKYILRRAFKELLPEKVLNRKVKQGFAAPTRDWFKGELKNQILELLHSREFEKRGYFDQKRILELFNLHCEGKKDLSYTIWPCINLELWFREFFDKKRNSSGGVRSHVQVV